jgi:small-conductance mechanosensitive channel
MTYEYSKILKYTFLAHFIVAIAFGLGYFFVPNVIMDITEWPFADFYVVRMLGAAFIGIACSSILSFLEDSWEKVKIVVQLELIWLVFGITGAFWTLLGSVEYPLFSIVGPLILVVFLVGFGYSYYLEEFKK